MLIWAFTKDAEHINAYTYSAHYSNEKRYMLPPNEKFVNDLQQEILIPAYD